MELSLISIATNGYAHYWLKMISGFVLEMDTIEKLVVHIITDDVDFVLANAPKNEKVEYRTHLIKSEPWPLPTLLRYKYINSIISEIDTEKFMYIDADMKIHPGFDSSLPDILNKKEIIFVAHPGYWRKALINVRHDGLLNVRQLVGDWLRILRFGGLGDWENRKSSLAFVPRNLRKTYICGGIWFGDVGVLSKLVDELEQNTEQDLKSGIVAKWHDESHLNAWFVKHGGWVASPEYCFDPTYAQLKGLQPRVEAVDKGQIKRT